MAIAINTMQTRLIRGIKDGSIKVNVTKERQIQ